MFVHPTKIIHPNDVPWDCWDPDIMDVEEEKKTDRARECERIWEKFYSDCEKKHEFYCNPTVLAKYI